MRTSAPLVAGCLALAAATVIWPRGRGRARRVLGGRRAHHPAAIPWRGFATALPHWPVRWVIAAAAAACGVAGGLLGGPVVAIVGAVYAGLAVRAALRARRDRLARRLGRQTLDALCSLAADLRAGLPPAVAWEALAGADQLDSAAAGRPSAWQQRRSEPIGSPPAGGAHLAGRMGRLTTAAWRLAEQTGAPLADLIERVESDARAADRAQNSASAQAAGATATAWLLGALPVGGIALGYAIGADPLRILLHTPIGAVCALTGLTLQLAGLLWAERLGTPRVAR
jgi:tight adherence protein B